MHPQLINMDYNKYPLFIMGVVVQVENGDKLFWKWKLQMAKEKA
jgi:hypothetical protein